MGARHHQRGRLRRGRTITDSVVVLALAVIGCDATVTPEPGPHIALSIPNLPALDTASEGTYEAWVIDRDARIHSAGRFAAPATPHDEILLSSPVPWFTHVMVTVEPPGVDDHQPSAHKLLGGRFDQGAAALSVTGYVTIAGVPLEPQPGTHVLGTPSNDGAHGKPSVEDAGLWLYNVGGDTLDGSFYLTFTPLTVGWAYEGWIVRDFGTPEAIWISYGKFRPDGFRQANSRDDTGLGFYSGRRDYEFALALEVRYPGDDWLDDVVGVAAPGGLSLPLDLNGNAAAGEPSRWTHVITIEPWEPLRPAEPPDRAAPFFLQPYRNPVGEAGPTVPRAIEFQPGTVPGGTATIRR